MAIPDHSRLADLQGQNRYTAIQIRCSATPAVLMARLVERAQTPLRHPEHRDLEQLQYLRDKYLNEPSPLLSLEWPLIELNTEQNSQESFDLLVNQIGDALARL